MSKILLIEDDRIIADGLVTALEHEGYEVLVARDGDAGLHAARTEAPDLVILDIMMPHLNGFEVTTELRRAGETVPIIVLSARAGLKDRVRGLDLGADDYLAKPFELEELLARIRRRLKEARGEVTRIGALGFDWDARRLVVIESQEEVALSSRELKLLEYVLRRPRRLLTRAQIIETVWGDEYDGTDRTVDNFIMALRRKIGGELLVTVRGEGYRFVPPAPEEKSGS